MPNKARRSPEEKQTLLENLQRETDGEIAQFFVTYNLGHAYHKAGIKSGKASKVGSAMAEAERQGISEKVYDTLAEKFGFVSHGKEDSLIRTEEGSNIAQPRSNRSVDPTARDSIPSPEADEKPTPTKSGRQRVTLGTVIALVGLAGALGSSVEPPREGSIGWLLIAFITITAIGLLIVTQTLGHRGSVTWRSISQTSVPGTHLAASSWVAYIFIALNKSDIAETLLVAITTFGTLWATVGFYVIRSSIREKIRVELSETSRAETQSKKEKKLSRAEILTICATAFGGIATLVAALYSK